MRFFRGSIALAVLVLSGITGCVTRETTSPAQPGERVDNRVQPARPADFQSPPAKADVPKSHAELFKLPAFEVRDSAFSDFGMSVRTNAEVRWGATIEWMLVSGIDAGSSAARMNLRVGDRILAIDGQLIPELDRDGMLALLFQRKKGERSQLLILGVRESLPRFVTLIASRPGS